MYATIYTPSPVQILLSHNNNNVSSLAAKLLTTLLTTNTTRAVAAFGDLTVVPFSYKIIRTNWQCVSKPAIMPEVKDNL